MPKMKKGKKSIGSYYDERAEFKPGSKGWSGNGPGMKDERASYKPNKSGNGPGAQGQRSGFFNGSKSQKGRS